MKFARLLEIAGDDPVFETGLLLAGDVDPGDVRRQLSRWTKAGRLYQFRRGLYALAPPHQKRTPHPFLIANHMVRGSYVSCQSALAHHGLIPEYVPTTTSVANARPRQWITPLGRFEFRHIKRDMMHHYRLEDLGNGQSAFIATPEKALVDLVHLDGKGDIGAFVAGLRLQNTELFDRARLREVVERSPSARLWGVLEAVADLAASERLAYESA